MQVALLLAVVLGTYSRPAAIRPDIHSIPSTADTTRGRIEGAITDSLDVDLKDVEVTLEGLDIKIRKTTKSKKDGSFAFSDLPVGNTYQLSFRRIGFRPEKRTVVLTQEKAPTLAIIMTREAYRLPDVGVTTSRYGTIKGEVVHFGGRFFESGQIWLKDSAKKYDDTKTVWEDGKFTFKDVPVGGPYTLIIKSLGYANARVDSVMIEPGEVKVINPLIMWTGSFLPEDTTRSPRAYKWLYATREDIKKHRVATAAGVIDRFNLGEPRRPVGFECYLRVRVYINGERVDDARPTILEDMPADDIDEIRYVTCWDESVPITQRNSWFIKATRKLKPKNAKKKDKEPTKE
jgi:carboxypeptidase family protein